MTNHDDALISQILCKLYTLVYNLFYTLGGGAPLKEEQSKKERKIFQHTNKWRHLWL